jgi:hypothetical protein
MRSKGENIGQHETKDRVKGKKRRKRTGAMYWKIRYCNNVVIRKQQRGNKEATTW